MKTSRISAALAQHCPEFDFQPFGTLLQPMIREIVSAGGLDNVRKGTILTPFVTIWLVLVLTMRRDLNCRKALNWMMSGLRWLQGCLPVAANLVSEGAVTHARVKIGVDVFRQLFSAMRTRFAPIRADFYERVTAVFDGTTGTTPDTKSNNARWGKPGARQGTAAFPQVRIMSLLVLSVREIWDVAYAPYRGKQTGERALMLTILDRLGGLVFLLLLDAGLYSFQMLRTLRQGGHDFIIKAPNTFTLPVLKRLPDGSFLTQITGKIEDLSKPVTATGRRHWKTETLMVRAISVQIAGYRPFFLLTSLVDPTIPARDIIRHYHARWDIEMAYDELKTHQCATLRGQSPTTFRSKRADLVEQELYAMMIMYNAIRHLMAEAATEHGVDPRTLSFLEAFHLMIDAAPILTAQSEGRQAVARVHLLANIADATIDRPRRHRINSRVVKVKSSKFARKKASDCSQQLNVEDDVKILEYQEEKA
ncbi:MAG: IS4 family transposase [bacterium]|nr:IS4 family transposase [bacterium]